MTRSRLRCRFFTQCRYTTPLTGRTKMIQIGAAKFQRWGLPTPKIAKSEHTENWQLQAWISRWVLTGSGSKLEGSEGFPFTPKRNSLAVGVQKYAKVPKKTNFHFFSGSGNTMTGCPNQNSPLHVKRFYLISTPKKSLIKIVIPYGITIVNSFTKFLHTWVKMRVCGKRLNQLS